MRSKLRLSVILLLIIPGLLPAQTDRNVTVQVQRLDDVLVRYERRAPAEVEPMNQPVLAAELAAVVVQIHADVGQKVSTGDLLIQLDSSDYQLNLQQAEASLASIRARKLQADARLERARELSGAQHISADELLERETDVLVSAANIKAAEVAVAVARRQLSKCEITAPFNGVISERFAQLGGYVGPASPLVRLTQLDAWELNAEIPANQAESLSEASDLRFESQGGQWRVTLLRLSPAIETDRRTRTARLAFAQEAPEVGRSGELVWRTAGGQLPASLISRRGASLGVFIHVEGRAEFVALPDAEQGRPVSVNLPPDTEVIVRGQDRLQDAMPVTAVR